MRTDPRPLPRGRAVLAAALALAALVLVGCAGKPVTPPPGWPASIAGRPLRVVGDEALVYATDRGSAAEAAGVVRRAARDLADGGDGGPRPGGRPGLIVVLDAGDPPLAAAFDEVADAGEGELAELLGNLPSLPGGDAEGASIVDAVRAIAPRLVPGEAAGLPPAGWVAVIPSRDLSRRTVRRAFAAGVSAVGEGGDLGFIERAALRRLIRSAEARALEAFEQARSATARAGLMAAGAGPGR